MNYDGTGKLSEALAALYGLSPKNHNDIAKLTKQAKDALGIAGKARRLSDDIKRAMYKWHYDRLYADKTLTPESLANTPLSDIEPALSIMADQAIADMPTPPSTSVTSNWGGVRPGAGRKSTGKQSVTVRVPVELLPMIENAKRTCLIPVTNNQVTELLAKVRELEKELHHSRLELKVLSEANARLMSERDKQID